MHDVNANKKLALDFLEALGRIDADRVGSYLAEDVIFETPGQFKEAGRRTKQQVTSELPDLRKLLPNGIKINIMTVTAEDDRVHIEATGQAKTIDGEDYNQFYHFAFVMRDGKIRGFRDYIDTDLVLRVLLPTYQRHLGGLGA